VIRLSLGKAAAFAVINGPGYRKLIVNTDDMDGRPLSEADRERGIAQWIRVLSAADPLPMQRTTA
jgi:hypothetical protein